MDRMSSRKQSEFGRRRGEEKLEAQALVTRIIDGEPAVGPAGGSTLGSKARSVVKKKSPVHEAMERAQQQAKEEALKQQQLDEERQRLMDLFAQRVDACADDTASRDRRAKIAEATRRALRQVEELAKFLGLDRFDPILANVTSLRPEDPELDLEHEIESKLKPLGVKPAEYFHSSLQQLENLQNALKNDAHLEETLEDEEKMLYEDAATTAEAVRILARDCVCGARLDQAIESAQYAATIQSRLQLTSLFSKVTMGCTNMIRQMEKMMLEKERRVAELIVSNSILVERAEQSRRDFETMERNTSKQVETLQKQLDNLLDGVNGAGGGAGGSSGPQGMKDRRGSTALMKGFMNDMNAVYIRQKEFFQRETMLIAAMKAAIGDTSTSSREVLESGLVTAFQHDPSVPEEDKKLNAPWVQKMLKRIQDYQRNRHALQQMECQLMQTHDIQDPVPRIARGIQTMREEDVPGSPAWEKKYAAMREAAAQSMRPASQQTLNIKEVVSQELVVRTEMRRCGFEYALGLPKRVTAGVENVLACAKELMLNLDYSRVAAVTKFTALLEEQGGSKIKAVDLGNSLQAAVESDVDDQLDHMRKALQGLKAAVIDELKPVYVQASSDDAAPVKTAAASNPQQGGSAAKMSALYKDLLTDITKKITSLLASQRIEFQRPAVDPGDDPVIAQIRSLDAIVESVPQPTAHHRRVRKQSTNDSASGNFEDDGEEQDKTLAQVGIMTSLVFVDAAELLNNLRSTISVKWDNEMQEALGNAQPVSEPAWSDVLAQLRQASEWCKNASNSLTKFRVEQAAAKSMAGIMGSKKSLVKLSSEVPGSKLQVSSGNAADEQQQQHIFDDIPVVTETIAPLPAKSQIQNTSAPLKREAAAQPPGKSASKQKKAPHAQRGKNSETSPPHSRKVETPPPAEKPFVDPETEQATQEVIGASLTLAGMMRQVMLRLTNVIATKGQIVCPLPEEVMEEAIRLESQYDPDAPTTAQGLQDAIDLIRKLTGWSDFISEVLDPSIYKAPPTPPPPPPTPPRVAVVAKQTMTTPVTTPLLASRKDADGFSTVSPASATPSTLLPGPQAVVDDDPLATAGDDIAEPEESPATEVVPVGPSMGGEPVVKPPTRGTVVGAKSKRHKSSGQKSPNVAAPLVPPAAHPASSKPSLTPKQEKRPSVTTTLPTAHLSAESIPSSGTGRSPIAGVLTPPITELSTLPDDEVHAAKDSQYDDLPSPPAQHSIQRRSTRRIGDAVSFVQETTKAAVVPFESESRKAAQVEPDDDDNPPPPALVRRLSSVKLNGGSFGPFTATPVESEADVAVLSSVAKIYPTLTQRLLDSDVDNLVVEMRDNRRRSSIRLSAPKLASDLCLLLVDELKLREDEVSSELRTDTNPAELLSATLAAVSRRRTTCGTIVASLAQGSAEAEIHRLEMMLRAAESTVGELLFDKMTREGKNEEEAMVAMQSAKKLFSAAANDPLCSSDLRRVQTPPVGSPITFRKISQGENQLPPRPEHGLSMFHAEGLGSIPSQQAVTNALRGLETLVDSRKGVSCLETVSPQSVVSSAMKKLCKELGQQERSALLNELIGPTVIQLHRTIMRLLTQQIFRRIKLQGSRQLVDPLADGASMVVPNIPELLKHDLAVVTSTLELLEEDSKQVVEKMKIVFQRVQANILISRIRRAQEQLLAQTQGIVRDVQADLLRRREEKIRSDLQRLTTLRENIRAKQRRNWNLDTRPVLTCAKIGLAAPYSVEDLLRAKIQNRDETEAQYMTMFLARMDRWFQYKRASVKKPTQQMVERVREANQSPSRRLVTTPPPEIQLKVFTPSVNVDVDHELSRRAQGSLFTRQKQLSTVKKIHPALSASPIVSDRQRSQIERVVSMMQFQEACAPVTASAPSQTPPCSPWVESGVMRHTPLPAIGSPPPTRQTSRIGSVTRVGGSSV